MVIPEFLDATTPLPPHRLVINAIGDAETSPEALMAAQTMLTRTTAPVINSPAAVMATGRSNNAKRLLGLPGVITAITATLKREQLSTSQAAATLARHGLEFPILLRTPGFHTGLHFLQAKNFAELAVALGELPGEEVIVMQYLDARGQDGKSRKYRVMMIGNELYPLHCAISSHWKIHYFTAEMAESAEHRAEDAAFLANMPEVLGPIAMRALSSIQSTLGLDYAGIDFGLNAKGEVLLFEANATMVVNPPDAEDPLEISPADLRAHSGSDPENADQQSFISSNLAGCSLTRIVEEELIAVGIVDHQKPVAPRTLLDRNALGLEFRAQPVQRGDRGIARRRLDVQGNEHQPLANLLRPRVRQDKCATLPIDLCDVRSAVFFVAPGAGEAQTVNVEAEGGLNIGHVQDGPCEPVCHKLCTPTSRKYRTWDLKC